MTCEGAKEARLVRGPYSLRKGLCQTLGEFWDGPTERFQLKQKRWAFVPLHQPVFKWKLPQGEGIILGEDSFQGGNYQL